MIEIKNILVEGFVPAIRGMRNPMNSWSNSDSFENGDDFEMGSNDTKLALTLAKEGSPNRKYLRMIKTITIAP